MGADNYIAQRLAAIGASGNSEIETLRAENARLKQQLEQVPAANFKSDAQAAFEQSPEFESILTTFFIRFMRDKFGAEFKGSPYITEFQGVANKAFEEFEKTFKKETPKNGTQVNKKGGQATGNVNAATGEADG